MKLLKVEHYYYIAVAVDKDGKPLATQGGDVTINYGTTSNYFR